MRDQTYYQELLPDNVYHLFSRAVGNEKLFIIEPNYHFFLKKFYQHTDGICDLLTYSLLPNHFHLMVEIRCAVEIETLFCKVKNRVFDEQRDSLPDFIMERFSNLLNSYAKAFNKIYHRKGGLFIDYLKRSVISQDADFAALVWYIHKNAVHHGLTNRIGEWKFDGYNEILGTEVTRLQREKVINFFGGPDQLINFHDQPIFLKSQVLDY